MEYIPEEIYELYTAEEKKLLKNLEELFKKWHAHFIESQKNQEYLVRTNEDDYSSNDISFDGFFPGYLKQKVKLLFLAKESRGLSGENYIKWLYKGIKDNKIEDQKLNQHLFYRRIFYVTYGLQNNETDYWKIPYPEEMIQDFGTEKLSCAVMNLSKFSNKSNRYEANPDLINKSVELSINGDTNFIEEEISLLDPDAIIGMYLHNYYDKIFGEKITQRYKSNASIPVYELKLKDKSYPLLDSYHFSNFSQITSEEYFITSLIKDTKEAIEKINR